MASPQEIVVTGIGVVSPIGIGKTAVWESLAACRSGIRELNLYNSPELPNPIGGDVADFDPRKYVRQRKSLKVMNRDIQLAVSAADMASADAGLHQRPIDPERLGVLFAADMMTCELPELIATYRKCTVDGQFDFTRWGPAAMAELFPLWLLKYLPNMPGCHIGILQDARGPNNSIVMGEVSGLSAVAEAIRVLRRGQADAMIVGGTGGRLHPAMWTRDGALPISKRRDNPTAACRPFDASRDGIVFGEGSAAMVLESRAHAEARGAVPQARLLGCGSGFEPRRQGQPLEGRAIRAAITAALQRSGLSAAEVGHVNAHGLSTPHDDRIEAQAIRQLLGDVPVTAPKSYFGDLGAGAGAMELAVSIFALAQGVVPPTLNYEHPDPDCPVNVVCGGPAKSRQPTALTLNHTSQGQAMALALAAP